MLGGFSSYYLGPCPFLMGGTRFMFVRPSSFFSDFQGRCCRRQRYQEKTTDPELDSSPTVPSGTDMRTRRVMTRCGTELIDAKHIDTARHGSFGT